MNLLLQHIRWYSEGTNGYGDLRIGRGRILEKGSALAPRRREQVVDGSGYLVLPGLINGHDHLDLNLFPQLGTPPYPNFYAWGRAIYHPDQPPLCDLLQVPLADRLWWSAYKQLCSGVTTVVHHDPYHPRVFRRPFPVKVLNRYGWSHSLGYSDDLVSAFRRSRGRPYILHAAEGVDEIAADEIAHLDRLGVLAPNTVLVHAIALSNEAIRTLAERQVSVVWCPSSNQHLYGQTAPIDALKGKVPVTIGTDATLSGPPTLWDELRAALATGLTDPDELLTMVTTTAASVFGLMDGRGTLRPEAPADLLLLPDAGASPAETLIASTSASLALVLINGTPRLADPTWAEQLGLDTRNAFVDGLPRWMTGSLPTLRTRIARLVDEAILSRNPLWTLLHNETPSPSIATGH